MASPRSLVSTTRFARLALAAGLSLAAAIALRGGDVRACAGGDPVIEAETTFDPGVLGDATWRGLYFDPYVAGYGERCDDCLQAAALADWRGYLGPALKEADWATVLYKLPEQDLAMIAARLGGSKTTPVPKPVTGSSIWATGVPADKLRAAIAFVRLARKVEVVDSFDAGYDANYQPIVVKPPPAELLAEAKAGLAGAPDAFLKQRYALQVMRVTFYRKDWASVESQLDTGSAALLAPSADLGWRARYYYAGALMRDHKRARANVELARIAAEAPALAGFAQRDFTPMEDLDWKKAMALATQTRDKAALWRAVGVKSDPLTAVREILKLDPGSPYIGLLMVRELARVESSVQINSYTQPDPAQLGAQKKSYVTLEQLASSLATAPATAQPWLMDLVAGHVAARRGDVATTRAHVQRALAARPGDARVAAQAKASLAIALVLDWKIDPAHQEELAKLMEGVEGTKGYERTASVRAEVRGKLAVAYLAAGKLADAELLMPGTLVPIDEYARRPVTSGDAFDKSKWNDAKFIQAMIARTGVTTTAFDQFVVRSSLTRDQLQRDLALRFLLDGDFASAGRAAAGVQAAQEPLHTDPFVIHNIDCHDCDHEKYATAPWTLTTVIAKLAALEKQAAGGGEPAAVAALQLGNAMYNLTWYGNARAATDDSHETSYDTRRAERWYKRAYDLTQDRELKARAAFLAAKCELARLVGSVPPDDGTGVAKPYDATPKTWYGVLKQYANTRYYKEVLKECGYFGAWVSGGPSPK